MKTIESIVEISASPEKVWDTMLEHESYKEWVNAAWPGSYYEGKWEEGENIKFISPGQGGTLATIVTCKPHEYVFAKHIAVLKPDGSEDRESETAKTWIGTTESYRFSEKNGHTELRTEMKTNPEWAKMFSDSWPNAIAKLKQMCEG